MTIFSEVYFDYIFVVCPKGYYFNTNNMNTCEICPVDTYNNDTNANSCMNCPSGTTTQELTGQKTEISCGTLHLNLKRLSFAALFHNSNKV